MNLGKGKILAIMTQFILSSRDKTSAQGTEMTPWVRALTAPPGDRGSFPSAHTEQLSGSLAPGDLFLASLKKKKRKKKVHLCLGFGAYRYERITAIFSSKW